MTTNHERLVRYRLQLEGSEASVSHRFSSFVDLLGKLHKEMLAPLPPLSVAPRPPGIKRAIATIEGWRMQVRPR
jgi:hypothetical protein